MKKIKALMATLGVLGITLLPTMGMAQVAMAATPGQNSTCAGANLDAGQIGQDGTCDISNTGAADNVNKMVRLFINIFSWIVGVVSVIMIIWGGFKYITSGGESGNVTSAKNTILYAIVGLVIVAVAQLVVKFVLGNVTNSATGIQ